MKKIQLLIFFGVIIAFGAIFWFTQKDSFSKNEGNNVAFPTISIPLNEDFSLQSPTPSAAPQGPVKEDTRATISAQIKTSKGDINIILYNDVAKFAVKNFINKAESDFWNNLTFHRVEDWVIQGGDPNGNGTGGGVQQTELTGKSFEVGSIGWAYGANMEISEQYRARISNDAQFFITKTNAPWLDTQATNFGEVVSGMDVVGAIQPGDKIISVEIK